MSQFRPHASPYSEDDDKKGVEPRLPPTELAAAYQQEQWDQEIHQNQFAPLARGFFLGQSFGDTFY
jgi:hypothetical protein